MEMIPYLVLLLRLAAALAALEQLHQLRGQMVAQVAAVVAANQPTRLLMVVQEIRQVLLRLKEITVEMARQAHPLQYAQVVVAAVREQPVPMEQLVPLTALPEQEVMVPSQQFLVLQ